MRQQTFISNSVPALVLRLVLALTFLWAGLSKVLGTQEFDPQQTARMAALDLSFTANPVVPMPEADPAPETGSSSETEDGSGLDAGSPEDVQPEPARPADPEPAGPGEGDAVDDETEGEVESEAVPVDPAPVDPAPVDPAPIDPIPVDPAPVDEPTAAEDSAPVIPEVGTYIIDGKVYVDGELVELPEVVGEEPSEDAGDADDASGEEVRAGEPTGASVVWVAQAEPLVEGLSPADFPAGSKARPMNGIALLIDAAANPPLDADSNPGPRTLPAGVGRAPWPGLLGWLAAVTEILAGLMLLVGLLTRLGAFAIFGTMLTAMWLTQFGPAIQSGDPLLGFLPNHPLGSIYPWRTFLWQLALVAGSFSLVCMGGGGMSIDRALFRRPSLPGRAGDGYDDTP